LGIRRSK